MRNNYSTILIVILFLFIVASDANQEHSQPHTKPVIKIKDNDQILALDENHLTESQLYKISHQLAVVRESIFDGITFVRFFDIDNDQSNEIIASGDQLGEESTTLIIIEKVKGRWTITNKSELPKGDSRKLTIGYIQKNRPAVVSNCPSEAVKGYYLGLCVYELKENKLVNTFIDIDSHTLDQLKGINRIPKLLPYIDLSGEYDLPNFSSIPTEIFSTYSKFEVDFKDVNHDGLLEIPTMKYDENKKEALIDWYQIMDTQKLTPIKTEYIGVQAKDHWRNNQSTLKKNPKYNQLPGLGPKDKNGRTPLQAVIDLEIAIQQKNKKVLFEVTDDYYANYLMKLWDYDGGKKGNENLRELNPCTIFQYYKEQNYYQFNLSFQNDDLAKGYQVSLKHGLWKVEYIIMEFITNERLAGKAQEILEIKHF